MKPSIVFLLAAIFALPISVYAQANAEANAEVHSSSSGSSSSSSKSVTVTSDGKNTVKRIVTTVNGVKKVVTETTDENGNTTTTSNDDSGKENEEEERAGGPWVGIRTKELSETLRGQLDLAEDEGLAVDAVAPDGPAEIGGIAKGDLLLDLAEESVSTSEELSKVINKHKVGETVGATIMRKGKRQELEITLAERPERKENSAPDQGEEADGDSGVGKAFDSLLDDPNVSESFKKSVKEMQKMLKEFEEKHGGK